jgi:hypothetical protein
MKREKRVCFSCLVNIVDLAKLGMLAVVLSLGACSGSENEINDVSSSSIDGMSSSSNGAGAVSSSSDAGYGNEINEETGISCNDIYAIENASIEENVGAICDNYFKIKDLVGDEAWNTTQMSYVDISSKDACVSQLKEHYNELNEGSEKEDNGAIDLVGNGKAKSCLENAFVSGLRGVDALLDCNYSKKSVRNAYIEQKEECGL